MPKHRIFAAMYDSLLAGVEKNGLSEMRADLLRQAAGRTLEIGAGTGFNLQHYTTKVTELVLTEPDPFMAVRLRRKLSLDPPTIGSVTVEEVPADSLPFESNSFDTVVSTLVLCSVEQPLKAAQEIMRVLKPEGRLLALEHVRSPNSDGLARWQDRLEGAWARFFGGCHPNRETRNTLAEARFEFESLDWVSFPKGGGPLVRPMIRGVAKRGDYRSISHTSQSQGSNASPSGEYDRI